MLSPKRERYKIIIVIVRVIVRKAGWSVPEMKASPRDGNWWYLYHLGKNINGRYGVLYTLVREGGERIVKK